MIFLCDNIVSVVQRNTSDTVAFLFYMGVYILFLGTIQKEVGTITHQPLGTSDLIGNLATNRSLVLRYN